MKKLVRPGKLKHDKKYQEDGNHHHPYGFKPPLEMLKRMAIIRRRLKQRLPLKDNLAPLPRE